MAWIRVKLPLLKAPLLTSAAIGFAVSIVQFVPAQLIAAGRYSSLPMEAVTLSSGWEQAPDGGVCAGARRAAAPRISRRLPCSGGRDGVETGGCEHRA